MYLLTFIYKNINEQTSWVENKENYCFLSLVLSAMITELRLNKHVSINEEESKFIVWKNFLKKSVLFSIKHFSISKSYI